MKKYSYLFSLFLLLVVWQLFHSLVSKSFVPTPVGTFIFLATNLSIVLQHLMASLIRILMAIFITVILGGIVGILTARNAKIDAWLSPLLYILYPIPKIAFLPLLMLFLGLGNGSKITLVGLILFFQIAISIRDSIKGLHPSYLLAIKSLGASKWQTYQHVILPAMLPNLFTSLRISVGTSISVLFFAENFATQYGIGYFIMDSWLKLDYTSMFAGIVAISIMGSTLFMLLDFLEKHFCRWQRKLY